MDGKHELTATNIEETKMAIVEYVPPGIWYQKCVYAAKPEWWTEPNVWQKLVVVESAGGTTGISDLFWEYMWYPLTEGMTIEELELTVRQIYPQFPDGVYEIHQLGAA
jgi:hypothetical protein